MPVKPSIVIEIEGSPLTKKNHLESPKKSTRLHVPKEIAAYEDYVHMVATEAMKEAGWPGPWAGMVTIGLDIRFKTWAERDIVNYWDSIADGLSGALYDDDCLYIRSFQCYQKSVTNPGVTVYAWFHDMEFNELGNRRRPREWMQLSVADIDFPETFPIVRSPEEISKPCRLAAYGIGRKREQREKKAAKSAAQKARTRKPRRIKTDNRKGSKSNVGNRTSNGSTPRSNTKRRR